MKITNYLWLGIIALSLFVASCEKEPGSKKGKVEFNASIENELKSLKSTDSATVINYALVEVQNAAGEVVLSNEKISLTQFGESYLSEPIALTTGSYKLTKFLLVNDQNVVVYAAPLEGSDKAYLVQNPLPIEFVVNEDIVTKISPEVIDAIGQTPQDFGYTTFSFNLVKTFDFLIAAFVYNDSIEDFSLTDASLQVKSNDEVLFTGKLAAITNQITVNSGYDVYNLTVSKLGYTTHELTFSKAELEAYFNSPLTIIFKKSSIDINDVFAYYPLNGDLTDLSGNGFNATNYGATYTTDRNGNANSAIYFDGISNYIVFPDSARFVPLQSTTLSFWISTSQQTRFDLFNQRTGDFDPDLFNHGIVVNNINTGLVHYRFPGYDDGTQFSYEDNFCDSTWHLLTFVKDCENKKFECYDGAQLIHSFDMVDYNFQINGQLILGKEFRNVCYFKGSIDDIRIYHRALTASEIEAFLTK
jgi:hypothetical protein